MKVWICEDGFIHSVSDNSTEGTIESGELIDIDVDFNFTNCPILGDRALPLYRVVDGVVEKITDPTIWQVEDAYWDAYIKNLRDEIVVQLNTKTDDELKAIFDNAPLYQKLMMTDEIEVQEAIKIDQTTMNLAMEVSIRLITNYLAITLVEKRELTEDETLGVAMILQSLRTYNLGFDMGISSTAWYQNFLNKFLENANNIRYGALSRRYYITGKV